AIEWDLGAIAAGGTATVTIHVDVAVTIGMASITVTNTALVSWLRHDPPGPAIGTEMTTLLADTDGDGVPDVTDGCPNDVNKTAPGVCGCGKAETDANLNGVADCIDPTLGPCPNNITVTAKNDNGIEVDFLLPAASSPLGNVTVTS